MKNFNYIIHAVGPRWNDYSEKEECYHDLKMTFYNIFMYTENKLEKAQSIAIPLISSGIFGVPKKFCCKALFNALEDYLADSDDLKRNLKIVRLVNIDDETNDELVKFFDEKFSRIDGYEKQSKVNIEKKDKIQETNEENLLKCRMCDCLMKQNEAKKIDCGCFYCFVCIEGIEQGSECECKFEK